MTTIALAIIAATAALLYRVNDRRALWKMEADELARLWHAECREARRLRDEVAQMRALLVKREAAHRS